MTSKSFGKIGLALGLASILVISLLAGCGGSTTVTATATKTVTSGGGTGATVTETKTVSSGGTGAAGANIVMYGDMVTNVGCLNTSIAHRGELVVFRARIVDPVTGKDMTDKDIKADSVLAKLPDGQSFKMGYAGHSGASPTDFFWSVAWEVPLNYPTGSLGYQYTAVANDGRTGSFKPFEIASSKLTIAAFDPNFVRAWTANITATGFSVKTLSISQGAKVTLTNKDTIPHTISFGSGDTQTLAPAGTYARVFSTAGTFTITDGTNTLTITVNAVS